MINLSAAYPAGKPTDDPCGGGGNLSAAYPAGKSGVTSSFVSFSLSAAYPAGKGCRRQRARPVCLSAAYPAGKANGSQGTTGQFLSAAYPAGKLTELRLSLPRVLSAAYPAGKRSSWGRWRNELLSAAYPAGKCSFSTHQNALFLSAAYQIQSAADRDKELAASAAAALSKKDGASASALAAEAGRTLSIRMWKRPAACIKLHAMNHFDELPHRDRSHEIEDEALVAFQTRLAASGCFILQASDRKDYGTDCQIEVMADGRATNVRVHVQLKRTEGSLNSDGSLSVAVRRTNLNYLLMQPYSFYACYHLPTGSLRICTTASVLRQYEHGGKPWMEQQSLTVTFTDEMSVERLQQQASLAHAGAVSSRDRRIEQTAASSANLPDTILWSIPDIYVPENPEQAGKLLQELYDRDADDVISAGFDRFSAALGRDSDVMGICFMSEINLGMAGLSLFPKRIEDGIVFFQSRLGGKQAGSSATT
jgi:hypothetical protein